MGGGSSSLKKSNHDLPSPIHVEEEKITEKSIHQDSQENPDEFRLNQLTQPIYISHVKTGNTLCSNDHILLLQDGSTTIEFRTPPKFQPTHISWHNGLIRDTTWCSDLNVFIVLTKDALFSVSPISLFTIETATNKPLVDLKISAYKTVKPYNDNVSFWRCTCAGETLYINYSGFGTVIDEYSLTASSCKHINRWTPPKTCATYEGIWCIRYQQETDQLGFSIMNSRNNQWHLEIRNRKEFALLWQIVLPLGNGDCELSTLPNREWLAVNSCGIRLIQISNQKLKAGVEYQRELKNAVAIGNLYFAIRTKNTIEIHQIKQSK
ncbi:unnamed protein product [Rotaria sp. Silwood2]|nr:unnamed protein product [Rotaria sp. Silwood2]CAF2622843.1 unnamed protein product [Rotaria sp. Silwood2]CAF3055692.1 unnamed protein product [Rotaria sp. Silwood2]CAF3849111.1 unnamed protein product [Rotaria sp. Silwood2]CAF4044464.1 unnamed protein product [Rotaria sp. Silwood2]